jgi:hypothetical protein
MIIGKIDKNERKISFHLNLKCTKCQKKVPGGMKTSESYFGSESFKKEIELFKKNYLCGICRDKKRITEKKYFF